jgi:hypothetical protein
VSPVRLYLDHSDTGHVFRFRRPDGTPAQIPGLRLKVYINLSALVRPGPTATHAAFADCILDTGAYLTIIPERVWSQFRPRAVATLPFDVAMPQNLRVISLPGGIFPYQLAEVPIHLQDRTGGFLDVTVVAQLTHDGGRLTIPMVLGLRGGILDSRVLRAEPDAAAPHGQTWTLEEP